MLYTLATTASHVIVWDDTTPQAVLVLCVPGGQRRRAPLLAASPSQLQATVSAAGRAAVAADASCPCQRPVTAPSATDYVTAMDSIDLAAVLPA